MLVMVIVQKHYTT